jgi:hypothetical protein
MVIEIEKALANTPGLSRFIVSNQFSVKIGIKPLE